MSKTSLFIMLCSPLSLIQCAAVLSSSSFLPFNPSDPPHVGLRTFRPLASTMQSAAPLPFEQKKAYFEKLSSSGQAEQKHEELIKACSSIRYTKNDMPLAVYLKALDHQSYKEWTTLAQKVTDTPAQTIENNIDFNDLTYACKLAIYVGERLDFSRVSADNAPFIFQSEPVSFRRKIYLKAIKKSGSSESEQHDIQCLWLANLCMALKYSSYDDHAQDALTILEAFSMALPNHENIFKPHAMTLNTLILNLEQLAKKAEHHGYPSSHLASLYYSAFSTEILCKKTQKKCFINTKLGYLALLMERFSKCKALTGPDAQSQLSIDLIRTYLGLYQ